MGVFIPKIKRKYAIQLSLVAIATLGILSDGLHYGWSSPAVPKLLQPDSPIPITTEEAKWISQIYIIGNLAGLIFSFCILTSLRRKLAIFLSVIPLLVGWIGIFLATSSTIILISRFICGVGKNMTFISVPMYVGEIADPKIRGILGTFMYVALNSGSLIAYSITPFFPLYVTPLIGILLIVLQFILMYFLPESPYYLLSVDDEDNARNSLKRLRCREDVENELNSISIAVKRQTESQSKFTELFTVKSNLKALGILVLLRNAQMMSGIGAFSLNTHSLFQQVDGNISPEISSIIYIILLLISTFVSMVTSDKFGRRTLMIFSCTAVTLLLICQGLFFYIKLETDLDTSAVSLMPLCNLVTFALVYRVGLGSIPLVMISELFPTNVKVAGIATTDLSYSLSSLLSNTIFQYLSEPFGFYTPFWIYAGYTAMAGFLLYLWLPETKGKTLEEIQYILMGKEYTSTKAIYNLDTLPKTPQERI